MSAFLSKCRQQLQWVLDRPVIILVAAVVVLIFGLFRMRENNSSAGMWSIVIIAAIMFMYALGQLTGLGFSMTF